jgi:hypothetical protein
LTDSRSQQRRYGNIQSAPSFVDPSSTSWSSGEPLDEEHLVEEEEEEDEEEDNARRRSESVSPSIFPSDPDPFARIRVSPPNTVLIDGTPASRPGTGTGTSLIRDQLRSSSLASQASRREISPGSSAIRPSLTEATPLLAKGDADGIGVYVEAGGGSPTLTTGTGRRRSSQAVGLKRRRSGEVGKSTNGQTVRPFSDLHDSQTRR